jgi:hypothetical protein
VLPILGGKRRTGLRKAEKFNAFYCLPPCATFLRTDRHQTGTRNGHTKRTRIISVIYSPTGDQTEKNKRTNNHHNHVFLNTNQRDSHPYASPKGHGTTPSAKCQRWSAVSPPGAAMRLTASRQSYDITRPKISRHTKQYQTFKMIPFPHSFTNANPPPQIQNNAEAQDHTVRHTAAL